MFAIKPSTCRGRTLRGHLSIHRSLVSSVKPVIVGPVISSASFAVYSCSLGPQIHHFFVPLMPEGSRAELLGLQHTEPRQRGQSSTSTMNQVPHRVGIPEIFVLQSFWKSLPVSPICSGVSQSSRTEGGKF